MGRPIRLLKVVALFATATTIPMTGAAAGSRHIHKHHKPVAAGVSHSAGHSFRHSLAAGESVAPTSRGGDVCPGNARGIDCKVWPPPIEQDADRRTGGGGNGM